ncbi:MAG: TIR domain-containing protein [Bacteroidia bacterium]|nr:TIR domain-containing protein [Bacteroidia bacterium]
MKHKCFISFKTEDLWYKKYIQENLDLDMIDKSLDVPIDSDDEDYIMRKIREDYLSDSTVTIHLIGAKSSEYLGWNEQRFIKRELQASLYNGKGNTRSGILGVVLPNMIDSIYLGRMNCWHCGGYHNSVNLKDTTVSEFRYNFFIPHKNKCVWSEEDRYCVLTKWNDFINNPKKYIDQAFCKRDHPIAEKIKVRP